MCYLCSSTALLDAPVRHGPRQVSASLCLVVLEGGSCNQPNLSVSMQVSQELLEWDSSQ